MTWTTKLITVAAIVAAAVVLLFTTPSAGAAERGLAADRAANVRPLMLADALQGKWKVQVDPDEDARRAGEKPYEDTLSFAGGQFASENGKKHGFKPVNYDEDTTRFGPGTFTAEPVSDKDGKAKWTGTITVDQIQGELTITKKDGTVLHYLYKGEKAR
jgi:hypothetical protein